MVELLNKVLFRTIPYNKMPSKRLPDFLPSFVVDGVVTCLSACMPACLLVFNHHCSLVGEQDSQPASQPASQPDGRTDGRTDGHFSGPHFSDGRYFGKKDFSGRKKYIYICMNVQGVYLYEYMCVKTDICDVEGRWEGNEFHSNFTLAVS